MGFHPPASEDVPESLDEVMRSQFAAFGNSEHVDLVEFGFIPEFFGGDLTSENWAIENVRFWG